MHDDGKWQDI
jgi:hypothetical protein